MKTKKSFDDRMNEGGVFFWIAAILGALGFWGFLWLIMALGVMAGM